MSRAIVAFALKNYHGDESIKQFVLDLIDPSKSNFDALKNHQGLAAPVARGRKPRTNKSDASLNGAAGETATVTAAATTTGEAVEENKQQGDEANIWDLKWAKNVEDLLGDENYKKHLLRQANRILLRLRLIF